MASCAGLDEAALVEAYTGRAPSEDAGVPPGLPDADTADPADTAAAECRPGDREARDCGGLNGRAREERLCPSGRWEEWSACADPDECADGSEEGGECDPAVAGGQRIRRCENGRWAAWGSCDRCSVAAPEGFVCVAPGTFRMGSPAGPEPPAEPGRADDETLHTVTLTHAFLLGQTEVRQDEWRRLMPTLPSLHVGCDACPAEHMSWYEALVYCNRRSVDEQLEPCYHRSAGGVYDLDDAAAGAVPVFPAGLDCEGYRLPLEAEWEYAARAGTTTPFYDPDAVFAVQRDGCSPALEPLAWYLCNADQQSDPAGTPQSHPVGGKRPNSLGLYDVAGNVLEWTWDDATPYPEGAVTAAVRATDPANGDRVARGGSWASYANQARSAHRLSVSAAERLDIVGFRVARSLSRW